MVVKRWLVAALLALALPAAAQVPPNTVTATLASASCTGAPGTGTGCTYLNVSGYASLAAQVSGIGTMTLTFEGSLDGTTYTALNMTPTNSTSSVTTTTGNGLWVGSVGGLRYARVRVSSFSSGTAVVTLQTAPSGGGSGGGGGGGSAPSGTIGAAVPATASPSAGKDIAGNLAYFNFDVSGNLLTAVTGAGSGGTSSVDGSAYTAGASAGTPMMAVRDDAATTACAEDKICLARLTSARALYIDLSLTAANTNKLLVTPDLPSGASTAVKQPALGTAGTASTDVITVQGIAAMTPLLVNGSGVTQPVSGTVTATGSGNFTVVQPTGTNLHAVLDTTSTTAVTQGTAANLNATVVGTGTFADQATLQTQTDTVMVGGVNVKEINGVAPLMGNGATGTGALRVSIANDSTGIVALTTGSAQIGHLEANQSVNLAQIAGSTAVADPCAVNAKVYTPISQATSTQILAGTSAKKIYFCSVSLVVADAENVSFVEGTGSVCGTGTAAVIGGTSAAAGLNFAANGGFVQGNGASAFAAETTNADNLCLLQSGSGRISGVLTSVVQ